MVTTSILLKLTEKYQSSWEESWQCKLYPKCCAQFLSSKQEAQRQASDEHTVTRNGSIVLLLMEASFYFSTYDGQFDHYHNVRLNLVSFI